MKRKDAKITMLVHSEAKVEFFRKYLERYIRIIGLSGRFAEINIFDVFCGTGIYDNGKKGSPIAAFDVVRSFRNEYPNSASVGINLFVNDSARDKVELVKEYIEAENAEYCFGSYTTESAEVNFKTIADTIERQGNNSRNLIFIDPYGYKEIDRTAIERLLQNGRSEVILFLPISYM